MSNHNEYFHFKVLDQSPKPGIWEINLYNRKNQNYQKHKSGHQTTTNTKIQTTVPRRRENASETKDPQSKLLSL